MESICNTRPAEYGVKLFDTHAHYDDERFDGVRDDILSTLPSNGIDLVVNVGASLDGTAKSIGLAEKYPHVYCSAGIHPDGAEDTTPLCDRMDILREYLRHPKCVALGEIGLDYYYGKDTREKQRELFKAQMEIADEVGKPVIIHDRDAHGECLEIVKEHPNTIGVFHCFSGSSELAKELFGMGWYISVGGVVTFNNARKLVEVVERLREIEGAKYRLLLETDCPYLTPVPHRGKTNNSLYMKYTAEKVASLMGMDYAELCGITYENGKRFYGIR